MVGEGAEGAHEPGDQEHGDETGLSSVSVTMLPVFGGALGPLISPVLMVKPRDGILVSWIRAWSCNLLKVTGAGYAMSCCIFFSFGDDRFEHANQGIFNGVIAALYRNADAQVGQPEGHHRGSLLREIDEQWVWAIIRRIRDRSYGQCAPSQWPTGGRRRS